MEHNVGRKDRALRLIIAIAFFVIGLTAPIGAGLRIILFFFSATALFTSIYGFCLLYRVLGISTHEEHGK